MGEVRVSQLKIAIDAIHADYEGVHVSGQPGMGKTEFISNLPKRLPGDYTVVSVTVRRHHSYEDVHKDILYNIRQEAPITEENTSRTTGGSASLGGIVGGGVTFDERESDLHKIQELTTDWSGTPVLLCLDDVHKLDEDRTRDVSGFVQELAEKLGDRIHLVTAGQLSGLNQPNICEIELGVYTKPETRRFLTNEIGPVDDEIVTQVYRRVEGHPLFLGLLTEISEEESDLQLPERHVREKIEQRYIDSLPADTAQFLRRVAPLVELNERVCASVVDDLSPAEADEILRRLDQRAIVEQVNRTDEGDNIYKIHGVFREFLIGKTRKETEIDRKAFQHHIHEVVRIGRSNEDDAMQTIFAHFLHAKLYLQSIHEDESSVNVFRDELDRMSLSAEDRVQVVLLAGIGVFSQELVPLWRAEIEIFQDLIYEHAEDEMYGDLTGSAIEWGLTRFEEDPPDISELQLDASLEDLPDEATDLSDIDLPDKHVSDLEQSWRAVIKFFLENEPHQAQVHQELFKQRLNQNGISVEIIDEFRETVVSVLEESELSATFTETVSEMEQSFEEEIEASLTSQIDLYQIRNNFLEVGEAAMTELLGNGIPQSGVVHDIIVEGGDVLEDAENPVFALLLYGGGVHYLSQVNAQDQITEDLQDRYQTQLNARREYEEKLEDPMFVFNGDIGTLEDPSSVETAELFRDEETEN